METKIDRNSCTNQDIKGKFVAREVLTCFSYEMQEVLENNIVDYADIENFYEYCCPNCGIGQQEPFDSEAQSEEFNTDYKYMCYECNEEFDTEPESEPQEVYEWWIVTDYLYRKLKARGHVVLEWGNNCYWGRCCSGQAILLDGIISDICEEMEILEGQKYEWKV